MRGDRPGSGAPRVAAGGSAAGADRARGGMPLWFKTGSSQTSRRSTNNGPRATRAARALRGVLVRDSGAEAGAARPDRTFSRSGLLARLGRSSDLEREGRDATRKWDRDSDELRHLVLASLLGSAGGIPDARDGRLTVESTLHLIDRSSAVSPPARPGRLVPGGHREIREGAQRGCATRQATQGSTS